MEYNEILESNFYQKDNSKNKLLDLIIGNANKEEKYLDLGANSFALLKYIAQNKNKFYYTGVDIDPNWFHNCETDFYTKYNLNDTTRRGLCITMDMNEYLDKLNEVSMFMPIETVKFDCIIMSSVLHESLKRPWEWRDYRQIIEKAFSVLNNGGRIIIRDGVIGDYFLNSNIRFNNHKIPCEFKDKELAFNLLTSYVNSKHSSFMRLDEIMLYDNHSKMNYYSRPFLKNFLSAYSWNPSGGLGFKREAEQDHFNLYIGDWTDIKNTLLNKFQDKIKIELDFYPDEYKKYISKLVKWNDGLEDLWKSNSAIMVITKED